MSRREHIKAPPEPKACPVCNYPSYDGETVCPGCGTLLDDQGQATHVRVVRQAKPLSPLIRLREASDAVVKSAVAYRNTMDVTMGMSMEQAMERLMVAMVELHNEVAEVLIAQYNAQKET